MLQSETMRAVPSRCRRGTLRRVRAGHIESLLDLVDHPRVGREVSLPGGLKAVAGYDSFYFSKTPRMSRRIRRMVSV